MMYNSMWLLVLCCLAAIGDSLSASLMEETKKAEQPMRPKPKRAQEMLMFGNQQNRHAESTNNAYNTPTAEKRTLASSSGLSGLKTALGDEEKYTHAKASANSLYNEAASPYERSYEYGKVLVNDLNEEKPRIWDVPPYPRYYMSEDRRKRSEKSTVTVRTTSTPPSSTSTFQVQMPTQQPVQAQMKRSVPIYTEPRYKRELDIDPEDVLTLLSLWENERRNRNWRKYANEEYDNLEDDTSMMEDEDPRNEIPWADVPVYSTHRYGADSLAPSDIGIVRTHPPSYYEQYGNQYGQQYDNGIQYGTAQYSAPYPQHAYYPPEKRFMVTRKRSQAYEPYITPAQLQLTPQSRYSNYQRRMVY